MIITQYFILDNDETDLVTDKAYTYGVVLNGLQA